MEEGEEEGKAEKKEVGKMRRWEKARLGMGRLGEARCRG